MLMVLCLLHRNSTPKSLSKLSWQRFTQEDVAKASPQHLVKEKVDPIIQQQKTLESGHIGSCLQS